MQCTKNIIKTIASSHKFQKMLSGKKEKKLQDIGHKENLIPRMEEHLGLGFCFRLQLSASTRHHMLFSRTGFISIVAKVHKCHRRGAMKHSVSETDSDLSLHPLQIPLIPTEVLPPILLFFS